MKIEPILLLILLMPGVLAATVRVNTTITLDYVGNDTLYLRTEDQDFILNATDQTDKSFTIQLVRETEDNLTDYERLMVHITNASSVCNSLAHDYNFSTKYAEQKSAFDNCTLALNTCDAQKDIYKGYYEQSESAKNNCTNVLTQVRNDKANSDRLVSQYSSSINNLTQENANLKAKPNEFNNGLFVGGIGAAIVAVIILSRYTNKKRPKTIREYGYTGQP